jgi:hypothetical protein
MREIAIWAALASAVALGACGYGNDKLQAAWQGVPAPATAGSTVPPAAATTSKPEAALPPAPAAETRKPFVVIRFEGAEPDYAPSLYDAMKGALERKPDVAFDLVAVTRDATRAERNLEDVLHTMTAMGLPASRVTLSAAASEDEATDEVWVYVR